ncbi:MAG TPA: FAD-dependent oxidoreductase [Candidatus Saccharimonadia bacterium]|nr:FAD-dependent oxidoreductase [Candidatus Saccharimonadia bacterium]
MPRQRLAIIGTGIAGLGCAHFLQHQYELTLYEANDYAGGHTNTITVQEEGRALPVDTGFMVFNRVTYPLLTRLFHELGVETQRTDMSFSVRHDPTGLEYNGSKLKTIFGRRIQLLSPRFWRFLMRIQRFNRETSEALEDPRFAEMTLREYVKLRNYGDDFLNLYLVPMGSAVWSTPPELMLDFPAITLMRFWHNHGFLGMHTRHPWWTVSGGAQSYVKKLTAPFRDRIQLSNPVERVSRTSEGTVLVQPREGPVVAYDKVILASHADQSLRLLADADAMESRLLGPFQYQPNSAVLHTDEKFMPKTRRCWAAWNYLVQPLRGGGIRPTTHYWMNQLQGVSEKVNYFVSLNADDMVDPDKVCKRIAYTHPLFDVAAVAAQKELPELNRRSTNQTTYFCGSYFRYGFHEDAFGSAVSLCRDILRGDPW